MRMLPIHHHALRAVCAFALFVTCCAPRCWSIPARAVSQDEPTATHRPAHHAHPSTPRPAATHRGTPAQAAALKAASESGRRLLPGFVKIPAGDFEMDSGEHVAYQSAAEEPVHRVSFRAYGMGATEVTRGEFAQFVAATGYVTDAEKNADKHAGCLSYKGDGKFDWVAGRSWRDVGFTQDHSHPVVCVSWNDAKNYVAWKSGRLGAAVRLPSEAEQEYALRAGGHTLYPWGANLDGACAHANIADASARRVYTYWPPTTCDDGYAQTAPVGNFPSNAFGLKDMAGNVWEWAQDFYHDTYAGAPADGSGWTSRSCGYRVLRGGSWIDYPETQRSALRVRYAPAHRSVFQGFRLAQDL